MEFQSTLPRGSDRCAVSWPQSCGRISIHAPSRERQISAAAFRAALRNFNPRSLAGATLMLISRQPKTAVFQSTLPRGSDIDALEALNTVSLISIHAPSRERHHDHPQRQKHGMISIHAPSRERHLCVILKFPGASISIHAPSRERQTATISVMGGKEISIHAPSRERHRVSQLAL